MPTAIGSEDVYGRVDELGALESLLTGVDTTVLTLEGEAGIGKTTLWRAGLALGRERGYVVLAASPSRVQQRFAYGALADLLSEVVPRLEELPVPQRRALAVALLLEEQEGPRLEQRSVAAALLSLLRLLAGEAPLLVAVDDVQWLDRASALALEYALPRIGSARARILLAARVEQEARVPLELARALPGARVQRLAIGGLSVGALRRLIHERLDLDLIRPTLQRMHDRTRGNPFFALELARALRDRPNGVAPGDPLPLPSDVEELVRRRLRRMAASSHEALLGAAMQRQPSLATLERAVPDAQASLERPLLDGVVELVGDRIRFTHPLFASGILALATPQHRRRLHARLADVVPDEEERTLHQALAAEGPDEGVASILERTAGRAERRGAGAVAAELYALAAELTPVRDEEALLRRVVEQGECLCACGDQKAGCALLEDLIARVRPGPARARLSTFLVSWQVDGFAGMVARLRQLVREARADPDVHTFVLRELSAYELSLGRCDAALRHGRRALALATKAGEPGSLALVLTTLACVEMYVGLPARDHLDLADEILRSVPESSRRVTSAWEQPQFNAGVAALWAGRLEEARTLLEPVYARLCEAHEDYHAVEAAVNLVDLEWRAGRWERATELADLCDELLGEIDQEYVGISSRARSALVAAGRGDVERARRLAGDGIRDSESATWKEYELINRWLLAFVDLSLGDAAGAAPALVALASEFDRTGFGDPGTIPFWGDAVESLVESGDVAEAAKLTRRLEKMAPGLEHPYRDALTARCRGLLACAEGDLDVARAELDDSAARFGGAGMPFERARSVLALGIAERRGKRRGAARKSLDEAVAELERLGAVQWAAAAKRERRRLGGRTASPDGQLTATEERVARLVVTGLSNKATAAQLFVTVRTVEATLTRVYAKLGVRSRGELAARLLSPRP